MTERQTPGRPLTECHITESRRAGASRASASLVGLFATLTLIVATQATEIAAQQSEATSPMSWAQFRQLDRVAPDHRVQWGAEAEQFGELYLPAALSPTPTPTPVAIVVHGGCWLSIADVSYMTHFARRIADAGWAVWVPEFRRADMPGGSWPGMMTDLAAATDHLRGLASDFALDLDRVVTLGHSSGGHLALWLAARPQLSDMDAPETAARLRGAQPIEPKAVIGLAAIADLDDYEARAGGGCGPDAVPTMLSSSASGASGDDPGIATTSAGPPVPLEVRRRLSQPGLHLPANLPVRLITGEQDVIVPVAHNEVFAAGQGAAVEVVAVPDAGHFEVVAPWTSPFEVVWAVIEPVLDGVFPTVGTSGARPDAGPEAGGAR